MEMPAKSPDRASASLWRLAIVGAGSVTIFCRGENLEKSMSRYLIDQLGHRSNIGVIFGAELSGVHGEAALEAIDVRDRATAGSSTATPTCWRRAPRASSRAVTCASAQ
jgi:hypothetical protein